MDRAGEALKKIIENLSQKTQSEGLSETTYECDICQDFTMVPVGENGGSTAYRECVCVKRKRIKARIKNLSLPEEFENCTFKNFNQETPMQKAMYESVSGYLKYLNEFIQQTKDGKKVKYPALNSLGMIAEFGEQSIKEIGNPKDRKEAKQKYQSYGLGKTHLQAAAANVLVKQLYQNVIFVRDIEIINELQGIKYKDNIKYAQRIEDLTRCDVLVWDDLASSKASEAKQEIYYEILNKRYVDRLPIMFSSNEDEETLSDRIGGRTMDRLFQMTGEYLLLLRGKSYRRG